MAAAATVMLGGPADAAGAQVPGAAHIVVLRVGYDPGGVLFSHASFISRVAPGRAGGVALLAHVDRLDDVLDAAIADPALDVTIRDVGGPEELAAALELERETIDAGQLWTVTPGRSDLPHLGTVSLEAAAVEASSAVEDEVLALTSDSTRRDGVVVAEDLLPTMRSVAGLPEDGGGGAVIRPVRAALPVDLYERYVANRRMSVPIQTAAGLFVTGVGLLGVSLIAARDRVPSWATSVGAWLAIAVTPLGISLLMAGHLETLTYASVLGVVIGGSALGCAAAAAVARRWGTVSALAALGAATIALFVLEAALGWTAASTTFLGGSQLDGGRFFGLPNVDIGLLLGAGVFVAHRAGGVWPGVAILAGITLFAGLPSVGANLGAAATFGAATGLWWGLLRERRSAWSIAVIAVAGAATAAALTLVASVALPGAPTHITDFAQGESGSVAETVVRRLRVGFDLIARNPFAIVPVIGVAAMVPAVLRPAEPIRASFDRHPGWREALLTILWGSVVAYVANDSGASALSMGFGTALSGLVFVSLRDRPWKMGTS